ncbi:ATP-dependent DNA helicase MPH1 [Candida viswanathii]|uniref:ATP-dependent DNA helicase MPH1 n=1 Tax=Candida viswanathii TaxID=5486 RepID=A0A367XSJ2_9ASCO|nr:ATP-dependent DNA helicase MPH1 [Candida viswanathii]
MPDDVETGFRSVSSMVRKVGDDKSLEERNRQKTFLDTLVDSDSDIGDDNDAGESLLSGNLNIKAVRRRNDPVIRDDDDDDDFSFSSDNDNDIEVVGAGTTPPANLSEEKLGVKRPTMVQMPVVEDLPDIVHTKPPIITREKSPVVTSSYQVTEPKRSLGIKRLRPLNIIDQLKKQKVKADDEPTLFQRATPPRVKTSSLEAPEATTAGSSLTNSICLDSDGNSEDDKIFDDGLNDDIGLVSSSTEPKIDSSQIFDVPDDEHQGF